MILSLMNSFDLKAEGSPPTTSVNCVVGMACIVALIALLSNSFVEVV